MELPFFTTTASSSSSGATREEALRWLAIGEKLLAGRDLVGSKSFAARARESDPTLLYADQIIAVADTLLAGDKRINNLPDWYAVLQLSPQQAFDGELVASQYRKLALLLNPQKNKLPFADQAFTLIVNAWQVISNPSRKAMYDNEVMPYLRVNPVSTGFNPLNTGIREQVNFQPFEINFQVMPQQQHAAGNREPLMHPQPQRGLVREPPPSMMMPQQNLIPESVSQQLPRQPLNKEQARHLQPQPPPPPPPQPQPHPHPHPHPQHQPPPARLSPKQTQIPAQHLRKESVMGNNVTHNFSGIVGDSSRNNNDTNDNANIDDNDDDVNGNNGSSDLREEERRMDGSSNDGVLSFWTACPYCYYMFEYPTAYEDCVLRCQNCKKAFQGVIIPSPPPIADGHDAYFCCWGLMPLGVSMEVLKRNKGKGGNWTPFSPMFNCPQGMGHHGTPGNWSSFGGWNVGAGYNSSRNVDYGNNNAGGGKKSSGPRVYVDDEDVFLEYSDPSEEEDDDWRTEMRKKKAKSEKKMNGVSSKTTGTPGRRGRKPKVDKGKNLGGAGSENVQQGFTVQEGVGVGTSNASAAEPSKKGTAITTRRHSARVAKDFGKLDLNVEFNNEVEEPAPRVSQGNGAGRGEEDIIEGSGFFEGLDEFLSTLPILNSVGEDKVKAA